MESPWLEEWRDERAHAPLDFAPFRDDTASTLFELLTSAERTGVTADLVGDIVGTLHLAANRGGDLALGELLPARRLLDRALSFDPALTCDGDEEAPPFLTESSIVAEVRRACAWCDERIATFISAGRREIHGSPHTFRLFDLLRRERCDERSSDEAFNLLFELPPHVAPGRWPRNGLGYAPTPIGRLIPVIRFLRLTEEDTFCDAGCGIGRPSLLVAITTPAQSHGIEISRERFAIARSLPDRWGLPNLHFTRGDLTKGDLNDASVLFLYNPLRHRAYPRFLDQLTERAVRQGRPERICTFAVLPALLETRGWRVINEACNRSEEILVFERSR